MKIILKYLYSDTGKYFLQTNGNMFDLSRGMDGVRYINENKTRLDIPPDYHVIKSPSEVPLDVQNMVLF